MKIKGKSSAEIFKDLNLEERSLYLVKVKASKNNIEHTAVLFTGFSNGAYCSLYNNGYDAPIRMQSVYSIDVIKKLEKLDR